MAHNPETKGKKKPDQFDYVKALAQKKQPTRKSINKVKRQMTNWDKYLNLSETKG